MAPIPVIYSVRVLRFMKFLPRGVTDDGEGYRPQDLMQIWTDPGGMRTLAIKEVRIGRKHKPRPGATT